MKFLWAHIRSLPFASLSRHAAVTFLPLLGTGGAALAMAPPPEEIGHVVLAAGDTLANGQVVQYLGDFGLDGTGRWAAHVYPVGASFPFGGAIVVDGQVFLASGSTLPSGETVGNIASMGIGEAGSIGATWNSGSSSAAALDQVVILQNGDAIAGPGIVAGTGVQAIGEIRVAEPFVFLTTILTIPGIGERHAALLMDFSAPGSPVIEQLVAEGDMLPGSLEVLAIVNHRGGCSVAPDGTYALDIRYRETSGEVNDLVLTDQGILAQVGTPSPFPGIVFNTYFPQVFATSGGAVAYAASLQDPVTQQVYGGLFGPGGQALISGAPLPGAAGLVMNPFLTARLEMNALTHEMVGLLPVEYPNVGWVEVLWYGGEVLADPVLDTISGQEFQVSEFHIGGGGERLIIQANAIPSAGFLLAVLERHIGEPTACPAVTNSTGNLGELAGSGSSYVSDNRLVLHASNLPVGEFGLLLGAPQEGFVANPGGSPGNLCLGGPIGRFNALVQMSDSAGNAQFPIDLAALPSPTGPVSAMPGETWYFQVWHRDNVPGAPASSNLTRALAISLR